MSRADLVNAVLRDGLPPDAERAAARLRVRAAPRARGRGRGLKNTPGARWRSDEPRCVSLVRLLQAGDRWVGAFSAAAKAPYVQTAPRPILLNAAGPVARATRSPTSSSAASPSKMPWTTPTPAPPAPMTAPATTLTAPTTRGPRNFIGRHRAVRPRTTIKRHRRERVGTLVIAPTMTMTAKQLIDEDPVD